MASETRSGRVVWSDEFRALEGWRLDAAFTLLALWMIAGVAWDFHVHTRGISIAEEGFFTASHAMFYSAFAVIVLLLSAVTLANYHGGDAFLAAIPRGYRFGVLGVGLFLLGGPADYLWHGQFGFEVGVEGLTSPSHLLLVVGATLFLSSPLRAAWVRGETPGSLRQVPMIVSATCVAAGVTFFTIYQSPFIQVLGAPSGPTPEESLLGILWFAAIVVGLCLSLAEQFRLAAGAFTLVFVLLGVLMRIVAPGFAFLAAMVITGVVADGLYYAVRDRWPTSRVLRLLGAAIPVTLYVAYFATVATRFGLTWTIHVWAGAIVSAGLVGLLVSYVVLPSPRSGKRNQA